MAGMDAGRIGSNLNKFSVNSVSSGEKRKLEAVCKDFEGVMLEMMYKGMKSGAAKSGAFSAGSGQETFQELLDSKMIEEAARGRGLGLADMLYRQLSRR